MSKNMVERERPQMTIWRMRAARWISKATCARRNMNTYHFTASIMASRTCLNIKSHEHCLSSYNIQLYPVARVSEWTVRKCASEMCNVCPPVTTAKRLTGTNEISYAGVPFKNVDTFQLPLISETRYELIYMRHCAGVKRKWRNVYRTRKCFEQKL